MALLRSILSEHHAPAADAYVPLVKIVSTTSETARAVARNMRQVEREANEVHTIVASRPLGVQAPRDEPKSIHSPSGRAMISFEPPKKRNKPAKRTSSGFEPGLPREAGRTFHRPVRGEW